jgi:hypothetical protein
VPMKSVPRNVVMQERVRILPDGSLEDYLKPRVTANTSDGAEESVNWGIPQRECEMQLPTVQQQGRGLAIVRSAAGPLPTLRDLEEAVGARDAMTDGESAQPGAEPIPFGQYMVDLESAYSFCPTQRAEWWMACFVWWTVDEAGRLTIGFSIEMRLAFGGAHAPNRFERLTLLLAAAIQRDQAAFDAQQPEPPRARRWAELRAQLQRRGDLPAGAAQRSPRHLQVYLDDFGGSALADPVQTPPEVAHCDIDLTATVAAGGRPAAPGTRLYVHAQLAIRRALTFGFHTSAGKVTVGDPVVGLGFQIDGAFGRMRCPARKRVIMLADMATQREMAMIESSVDRRRAETLVGRLVNLSQIFPELMAFMHGGYTVMGRVAGRQMPNRRRLRPGRAAQVGWVRLLDEASRLIDENEGVPLFPRSRFPPRGDAGVWTSTTDASGVDGVGGYVYAAEAPGEIWVVSERWPPDVLEALRRTASQGAERARARQSGEPMLAMPAAELLGMWLVPTAAARQARVQPLAVYAIGDCEPAIFDTNTASGGNPQMREALIGMRALCDQWLAVHVHRELNSDADRLSHPQEALAVIREAAAAGLTVHEARIGHGDWARVRATAMAGAGGGPSISRGDEAALGGRAPSKRARLS